MDQSIQTRFDREFTPICDRLVKMSQQVDWAIERAMYAVMERNIETANEVISRDIEINQLRYAIEEACVVLIATRQPAASDLRSVIAVMHMTVELERMGDHAAGIAKTVLLMETETMVKTLKRIPRMAKLSRKMLKDSIQAFLDRDVDAAFKVAERDDEMDKLYHSVFNRLLEIMIKDEAKISSATYLSWCAHNLERIADRVTNLAEQVIFMMTGAMRDLDH
jgi:phosphate transport system protein